ncbi:hypothetical protein C6P44_002026 [Monosporozyma unispora]|nr:hypothetical protein C6P44_002026 [Kazachstania unispora]
MTISQTEYISKQLTNSYTTMKEEEILKEDILIDQLFDLCNKSVVNPLLEFNDRIMEYVIYPHGFTISPAKLIKNKECLTTKHVVVATVPSFGHPVLLQLIALKNLLLKTLKVDVENDKSTIINSLIRSHEIIKHIFEFLGRDKVIETRQDIDTHIIEHFGPQMIQFDKLFGLINTIFNSLIQSQQSTLVHTIAPKCIVNIEKLTSSSQELYLNIIRDSRALKDYSIFKDTVSCEDQEILHQNSEFIQFLHTRKTLLHLNNRRIL